jgi:hypothetical protein
MWRNLLILSLMACGPKEKKTDGDDDDDVVNTGDDDDGVTGCVDDEACEAYTICDLDTDSDTYGECIFGDRTNAPDEAVPLELSANIDLPEKLLGMINPPGDVDYYSYETSGSEWVSIRTETDNGRNYLDTYVTVSDPSGNVYAFLDNYPTGLVSEPLDTVLYTYFADPGVYTIAVEDVTTAKAYEDLFTEDDWRGDEDMTYSVYIRAAGAVSEPDGPDDAVGVSLSNGLSISALGVLVQEDGDVDHIELTTAVAGEPLEVWVQPGRPGSDADALLRMFDPDGNLVASKEAGDGSNGYLSLFNPVAGAYRIEATTTDGLGGPSAWYVVYMRTYEPEGFHPFFGDSAYGFELEPNDDRGDATDLTPELVTLSDGTEYTSWYAEGTLDVDGDIDVFSIDVPPDHVLSTRCFTERFGSLAEITVDVYDGGFSVLPEGQGEGPTEQEYYLWNVEADGVTSLQVQGAAGSFGPGAYYRCVSFATDFLLDEDAL